MTHQKNYGFPAASYTACVCAILAPKTLEVTQAMKTPDNDPTGSEDSPVIRNRGHSD